MLLSTRGRRAARICRWSPTAVLFAAAWSIPAPVLAQSETADARIEALERQMELMRQELERLRQDARAEPELAPPPARTFAAPEVTSGNDKIKLTVSGQVNRGVLFSDDGENQDVFFVDNDNSSTRVRFVGIGELSEELSVGTNIEVQIEANSTADVSQDMQDTGSVGFTDRKLEFFFDHDTFGKVSVGQGDTASNSTSEVDLSGVDVVGYSSISDFAGGLQFRGEDGLLTGTAIGDVTSNFDGLSRQDRVRYDSPELFGSGVRLATSAVADRRYDAAVRFGRSVSGLRFDSAFAFARDQPNERNQFNGSASARLDNGVNVTVAGGLRDFDDDGRENATFYYGKLGYIFDFFSLGSTAVAIDYFRGEDIGQDGDEADVIGVFAVQNIDQVATELYAGYRNHSLDRDGADVDDINAVLTGARVKF